MFIDQATDMHTTMEDIARICGVTKMTVSRVLGGRANVHKNTRAKVLSTARDLDYHPNSLAKSLNANRSGFIGVATPFTGFLASDYFGWDFIWVRAGAARGGSGLRLV